MRNRSTKSIKDAVVFGLFNIYISEQELSEEKLKEYIKLNKNKVQNVWIDEYKKWLKELRDSISQKCMIKREIRMEIKELKSEEEEDKIDILEWKLRTEKYQ